MKGILRSALSWRVNLLKTFQYQVLSDEFPNFFDFNLLSLQLLLRDAVKNFLLVLTVVM